jgi:hypothetical protein
MTEKQFFNHIKLTTMTWFWKHKKTGQVVDHANYLDLKDVHKRDFMTTNEETQATHTVDYNAGGDLLLGALVIEELSSDMQSTESTDNSFGGFDGGDGGGGGAGGDF